MALTNYRELSKSGSDTQAGFQFEFHCGNCTRTWKSPFKPYRKGQLAGLIYKFAYFLGDRGGMSRTSSSIADVGAERARSSALQDALELAEERYAECTECRRTVCEDCWNMGAQRCVRCNGEGGGSRARAGDTSSGGSGGASRSGAVGGDSLKCPNCSATSDGGRFCSECGFDMASTHKSCPGCGTLCSRSARFCTDCGHAF